MGMNVPGNALVSFPSQVNQVVYITTFMTEYFFNSKFEIRHNFFSLNLITIGKVSVKKSFFKPTGFR